MQKKKTLEELEDHGTRGKNERRIMKKKRLSWKVGLEDHEVKRTKKKKHLKKN